MKNLKYSIQRFIMGLKRPTKKYNTRRLKAMGVDLSSIIFREAEEKDIPALAALHVSTWNQTYWYVRNPPSFALREYQWQEQFKARNNNNWICILAESNTGPLIGFAKGKIYKHEGLPGFGGELNKIYLLREYQRMGLGKKLAGHIVNWLLKKGINTMVLFSEPQNPSGHFFEALGGQKLFDDKGRFNGGYEWKNLERLAEICNDFSDRPSSETK